MWLGLGVVLAGSVAARHKRLRPLLPRLHLPCLSLLRVLLRPLLRPQRRDAAGHQANPLPARLPASQRRLPPHPTQPVLTLPQLTLVLSPRRGRRS